MYLDAGKQRHSKSTTSTQHQFDYRWRQPRSGRPAALNYLNESGGTHLGMLGGGGGAWAEERAPMPAVGLLDRSL